MNKQKMGNIGKTDQSFSLWQTLNGFSTCLSYQHILCKKKNNKVGNCEGITHLGEGGEGLGGCNVLAIT